MLNSHVKGLFNLLLAGDSDPEWTRIQVGLRIPIRIRNQV